MKQPRILMYAVDGLGLGHVTRLLGLARALRRLVPGAEILFVTSSEAAHIIYREGFAALKVPSRSAARHGGLRRDTFVRLTQSAVWNAMTAFDPHVLVVDTFAAGALGELPPVLRWAGRKVFVFRAQKIERASESGLQSLLELYDLILVPHALGSEEVPLPDRVPCVWTGPMLGWRPNELLSREHAREALELPSAGEIGLISLGGGGDPDLESARAALRVAIAQNNPAVLWVEFCGPLSSDARRLSDDIEDARDWPANYRVRRDVHPQMLFCRAFDCAVAAAGYNTTHELQAANVPSLLWPFARDLDDQQKRARDLARDNRALVVETGESLEHSLSRALSDLADAARRSQMRAGMQKHVETNGGAAAWNGTDVGAMAILRTLGIEADDSPWGASAVL